MMLRTLVHEQKVMACLQCLAYVKLVHIPPFLLLFHDSHYCFCMISDFHAEIVKNHTTPGAFENSVGVIVSMAPTKQVSVDSAIFIMSLLVVSVIGHHF